MANGITKYSVQEAQNAALGQSGYDLVTNATVNAHTYIAITMVTECVVTATSVDTSIWDTLTTVTLPAGLTIYGRWSSVLIASGDTAIVYRG